MRTLLLASLASLTVTAALQNSADACGDYGDYLRPTVFRLSAHSILEGREWSTRTFALLRQAPEGTPAWRQIAPGTYDYTKIAFASNLETPADLTLVGPSGTHVMSTRSRVFLQPAWGATKATTALEVTVKRGDFAIALAGRHTDVKWLAVEAERTGTPADVEWIEQTSRNNVPQKIDPNYVYVSQVKGTAFQTVTAMRTDGSMVSFVRSGQHEVTRFAGTVAGVITIKNRTFVLQSLDGEVRAQRI